MRYFYSSFIVFALGLGLAYFIAGIQGVYIAFILTLLEISLSFDNAVVNAKVLGNMNERWIKRFITYGMIIAVFGMRLLFPLLIVYLTSNFGFWETLQVAIHNPLQYENILVASQSLIFAFGGSFLLMVFLEFLFENKSIHWIHFLENSKITHKLSLIKSIELIISLFVLLLIINLSLDLSIAIAYIWGILLFSFLKALDSVFSTKMIKNGFIGFIYLEILDASFSFDGVIGAFAISSNIFIIMIGLGIGAMFVRSLTLYFVYTHTLSKYKYLEHGAHYAIGILAFVMLSKIFIHIDENIIAVASIILILMSLWHSIYENKRGVYEK